MSNDAVAGATSNSLVQRISEGVGIIRERTVEIGARVIWIDNIGSLVILNGQRNFAMSIMGGLLMLVGFISLQDNSGMALLLIVGGIGLIIFNLSQPIINGLSIGTTDGRSTVIVSDNQHFLDTTLDLLREKIDTGSITLQGTFDIGSTHVNTGGGGVAVGRNAEALGRGEAVQRQAVAAASPPPAPAAPIEAPPPMNEEDAAPRAQWNSYDDPVDDQHSISSGGGARIAVFLAIALLVVGGAGGGGYYWWKQEQDARAAEAAWNAVSRHDVQALRQYLADDPGVYRGDAEGALSQLEGDRYSEARSADTIEALRAFIADFPESEHALAARGRIAEIEAAAELAAAAAALEAASTPYAGVWRGTIQQNNRAYDIVVVFQSNNDNRLSATIEYPGLRCSGAWEGELGSTSLPGARRVREIIRDGRRRCVDGVVEMTPTADSGVSLVYFYPDGRSVGAAGVIYPSAAAPLKP